MNVIVRLDFIFIVSSILIIPYKKWLLQTIYSPSLLLKSIEH